ARTMTSFQMAWSCHRESSGCATGQSFHRGMIAGLVSSARLFPAQNGCGNALARQVVLVRQMDGAALQQGVNGGVIEQVDVFGLGGVVDGNPVGGFVELTPDPLAGGKEQGVHLAETRRLDNLRDLRG